VRKISNLKLKMFAALVLRAMARELAEQGTERVSPRDRGVASRLGMEPDSPELAAAERYLVLEDYIRPSSPDHNDGPFIITKFGWKDLGYQLSSEGWRVRPFGKGCLGPSARVWGLGQIYTQWYNQNGAEALRPRLP